MAHIFPHIPLDVFTKRKEQWELWDHVLWLERLGLRETADIVELRSIELCSMNKEGE